MKFPNNITVLTLLLGLLGHLVKVAAYSKSAYSSLTLPRPAGRSDWHHEQFQKLYLASLEVGAQTNFIYWCGPTLGGYCGSTSFDDINTDAVTHTTFAFTLITSDGTVSYDYDQGSVQQYNSSILIEKDIMAGLALGGSGTPADNCLDNIDNCVATLGKTLEYYENIGSPFYFVDSDFEQPTNAQQMQNLITFWLTFNAQFPGYLITMAPECAYLWCGEANWPYNAYVPVINELGPYGKNIIYKINVQAYNNWCSYSEAGTVQFFVDVSKTFIVACPLTGHLGLEIAPSIFGLGVLAANKDGDGYATGPTVTSAIQVIEENHGSSNGMSWNSLTDAENSHEITYAIKAAAPKPVDSSPKPTQALTAAPTTGAPKSVAPTTGASKTVAPMTGAPTVEPSSTAVPTVPTEQPTLKPTSDKNPDESPINSRTISIAAAGVGIGVALSVTCFFTYNRCCPARLVEYRSVETKNPFVL